ncbi:MAG: hypothetical protein IPK79_12315 [Vampirovibrionales bacterium]|nr:hypothetical protein [Vampirovibrionales bacterium]
MRRQALKTLAGQFQANQAPGPYATQTQESVFTDPDRGGREIKTLLYQPVKAEGDTSAAPLVMLSHGLGGSEKTLGYLAEHLASHGYAVMALNHPGSDVEAERAVKHQFYQTKLHDFGVSEEAIQELSENGRLTEAGVSRFLSNRGVDEGQISQLNREAEKSVTDALLDHNPQQWADRPQDVTFVLNQLEAQALSQPELAPRIDFNNIAAAGHSYGSFTTLALAGAEVKTADGATKSFLDPRIKAAYVLSPIGSREDRGPFTSTSFQSLKTPVFGVAGSEEDPEFRSQPVKLGPETENHYMTVLNGKRHIDFGNGGDEETHTFVNGSALTFLDAYMRSDLVSLSALNDLPTGEGRLERNPFFKR